MFELFTPYINSFISEQKELKEKNKEKLAQIKKEYQDAASLPRKKKKAVRKRCEKDYLFWYSIGKWHDEIVGDFI